MQWDADDNIYEMISNGRGINQISCFMEVLIMGCWSLWNHRNNTIENLLIFLFVLISLKRVLHLLAIELSLV
jgi:hypothetical protein